ncbi:MAG: SulP family inorganic anion transporter [Rubrivivax sp.]
MPDSHPTGSAAAAAADRSDPAGTAGLRAWAADLLAAATASIVTLAVWLTLAVLAYAALGAAAGPVGIRAACAAVTAGALVVALLGRSVMPAAAPSSATALIFASAVARLAADPALQPLAAPAQVALLVAAASCCVVAMGLLQLLFGLLRLGSVARRVPQPVLAGFMNGVAWLALLAQVPVLLGLPAGAAAAGPQAWLAQAQPATLAVALATAGCVWWVARRWPRAPAALLGLGAGCLLYAVIRLAWPAAALGPLVGPLPPQLPQPDALLPLLGAGGGRELLLRHAQPLLMTALALAVVGSLENVLNALAIDHLTLARHDPDRELLAFGAGNVASGLFGGLPLTYMRSRAAVLLASGAVSRRAAVACAPLTAALYAAGSGLIARLPLCVLAGLMVTVAWSLVDRDSLRALALAVRGRLPPERRLQLALMVAVFGVTLWLGFAAGVAVGVLLAMGLFIHGMNRSLFRSRHHADALPSRRVYAPAQERWLQQARRRVLLLELEGALFFGNAETLAAQAERLDGGEAFLVLDFRRVSTLDPSGALALTQLAQRLAARGCTLLLAGVSPGNRHGRMLAALGAPPAAQQARCFDDTDRATEFAEQQLLAAAGFADDDEGVPLAACALLQGLDAGQAARLQAAMPARRLQAGERLFSEGDAGDCLYVLTQGSVTVRSAGAQEGAGHRYVSFSPGMMLGEMAMLDGRGRSADALADRPSQVHALTRDALERLAREDPELARRLATNIALHLAERLRHAATAWRLAAA